MAMIDDARQWLFVADMNHSGSVTISDIWLWFDWLYYWPGDSLIAMFMVIPDVARFFELTYNDYGGHLSGIVSFIMWCGVIIHALIYGALIFEFLRKEFNSKPEVQQDNSKNTSESP